MTGRERVLCAAGGGAPDRVPVLPLARLAYYRWAGIEPAEREHLPERLLGALLAGQAATGVDGLEGRASYDAEVAAMGGTLWHKPGFIPSVVEPWLVRNPEDLAKLAVPDPAKAPDLAREIELVQRLRRDTPDLAVVSYVQGPLRLATRLAGPDWVLRALLRERDFLTELLSFAVRVSVLRAQALIVAGSDVIQVSDPYASPEVISPTCYREIVQPWEAALVAAVHQAGAVSMLHICGDTGSIFDYMLETGAKVLSLDAPVDLHWARQRAGKDRCLMGNVSPLLLVGEGTADQVAQEAEQALEHGGRQSFILSAGCAVPPEASPESLVRLVQARDSWETEVSQPA